MSISDELQKLDELRRSGALSADEFEIAKGKVLHGSQDFAGADQFEEIKSQNEIAQLDSEWMLERENYMVQGKHGHRRVPGKVSSILGGLIIVAFGVFWTVGASRMTVVDGFGGPSGGGGFSFFPLFGILFILVGAGTSIWSFLKAGQYNEAEEQYKRRRREILKNKR